MMLMLRFALAGIVAVFAFVPIMAHDFDVSSQKGELQIVLPDSGNKVRHQDNNINPIPQQYPATVNHGADNGTNYKQVGEVWGDVSSEYPKLLFKLYSVVCDDDA